MHKITSCQTCFWQKMTFLFVYCNIHFLSTSFNTLSNEFSAEQPKVAERKQILFVKSSQKAIAMGAHSIRSLSNVRVSSFRHPSHHHQQTVFEFEWKITFDTSSNEYAGQRQRTEATAFQIIYYDILIQSGSKFMPNLEYQLACLIHTYTWANLCRRCVAQKSFLIISQYTGFCLLFHAKHLFLVCSAWRMEESIFLFIGTLPSSLPRLIWQMIKVTHKKTFEMYRQKDRRFCFFFCRNCFAHTPKCFVLTTALPVKVRTKPERRWKKKTVHKANLSSCVYIILLCGLRITFSFCLFFFWTFPSLLHASDGVC